MPECAVLPGAEPFSAAGGRQGALVLHGFTGSPHSMRGLAEALAGAGFTVELPRLSGHGTTVEDMATTGWADWSATAEMAYQDLADRCDQLIVVGLSMGGTLTAWLAAHHPEITGIAVVNPQIEPTPPAVRDVLNLAVTQGVTEAPSIGSDIAQPGVAELAYNRVPIACIISLAEALDDLQPRLGDIGCPVLVFTSPQDHVVPPSSSDALAARVSGPVERVTLPNSYHVATLDYDRPLIEEKVLEFARRTTAASSIMGNPPVQGR
jgi:carboxylesterase